MYNMLEEMFGFVFMSSFPANGEYSEFLFHKLSNRERVDMLTAFINFGELNQEVKDRLLYAIRCFDICTNNRNIVLHATSDSDPSQAFRLSKRARNNPSQTNFYQVPLETLRRVADDAAEAFNYWAKLFYWLTERRASPKRPLPLPDKPPQPYRLSPSRPAAADANMPLPPPPSEA